MSNKAADNVVIRNIYYMMAYAFRALDLKEYERLKTEDFEEVDNLLAAILAIGMAAQQRRGYERGYLPEEDDLAGVRGRIDLKQTARNELARRQKTHCVYDEFTELSAIDWYSNRGSSSHVTLSKKSPTAATRFCHDNSETTISCALSQPIRRRASVYDDKGAHPARRIRTFRRLIPSLPDLEG